MLLSTMNQSEKWHKITVFWLDVSNLLQENSKNSWHSIEKGYSQSENSIFVSFFWLAEYSNTKFDHWSKLPLTDATL